ncbi:RNA 2',3'-cyclic phosphodiesterase [Numidum massiliense]|uniref:RNA 2',3'-cyclic phosphodiesterase n=1 Tax=Numidum massiliense TaxID=1522315 RepID=UPI0006D56FFE|nr:RNA 2',3'-cyclic phosphodiesterase [Numidum massiliense]
MHDRPSRLFVALPLSQDVRAVLYRWTRTECERLPFRKWVHRDDYHITLHFLGDCAPSQTEAIAEKLRIAADQVSPFSLQLTSHLGTFGKREQPRILWAGVAGDTSALKRLQAAVVTALTPLGFAGEERPYRPHITIARQYRRRDFSLERLTPLHPFPTTPRQEPTQQERIMQRERMTRQQQTTKREQSALQGPVTWRVSHIALFRTQPGQLPLYETVAHRPLRAT